LDTKTQAPRRNRLGLFWVCFFGIQRGFGGATWACRWRWVTAPHSAPSMPPLFHGEFFTKVLGTHSDCVIPIGIGVCLAGIANCLGTSH